MQSVFKNQKLEHCKDELKTLLLKLVQGNYNTTAQTIFDHVAHTGVETDLDAELKHKPTLKEFLDAN